MPNYHRNRVPGGTYFFTANLLDRKSDLLVTHVDALPRRGSYGADARTLSHRRLGRAAGTHALHLDAPARRCRLNRPVAGLEEGVYEIHPCQRAALCGPNQPGRTRYLAATVLGAHDPRRAGLRSPIWITSTSTRSSTRSRRIRRTGRFLHSVIALRPGFIHPDGAARMTSQMKPGSVCDVGVVAHGAALMRTTISGLLWHIRPAVHVQHLAGHQGARLRREEGGGVRDVGG